MEEPFKSGFTKEAIAGVIFDRFGKEWEYHICHYTEEEMEKSSEEDDSLMDHNTPSETSPDESLDEESSRSSHFGTQTEVQVVILMIPFSSIHRDEWSSNEKHMENRD